MAKKIVWGKLISEEQLFLQVAPRFDDSKKKPSSDPLMFLLDTSEDEEAYKDEYFVFPMTDQAKLLYFLSKESPDVPFLICHPACVPHEFRQSGFCANA